MLLLASSLSAYAIDEGNIKTGRSTVDGRYNVFNGDGDNIKGNSNVIIGSDNKQQSPYSVNSLSFGNRNQFENNSISIGSGIKSKMHGMAIGNYASADQASTAIGNKSNSSGYYSMAIGNNAQTSVLEENKPTNVGNKEITKDENNNTSIYNKEGDVSGSYGAVALGASSSSHNTYSTAIGGFFTATGKNSTAIGHGTLANGESSVALGDEAMSRASNSIAIGSNSISDRENTVSVGSTENLRQITNVADGTENNDAINVSQLNEMVKNSNAYTNDKVTEINTRTDDLINKEQQVRIDSSNIEKTGREQGDANTLKNANIYTDGKVSDISTKVSQTAVNRSSEYTNNKFVEANTYTDNKFSQLKSEINKVDKKLIKGWHHLPHYLDYSNLILSENLTLLLALAVSEMNQQLR
ncbi:hypothetical protein NZT23_003982 [Salmonella enterica]|nr:hypothetical protein [Salmonella enterica]